MCDLKYKEVNSLYEDKHDYKRSVLDYLLDLGCIMDKLISLKYSNKSKDQDRENPFGPAEFVLSLLQKFKFDEVIREKDSKNSSSQKWENDIKTEVFYKFVQEFLLKIDIDSSLKTGGLGGISLYDFINDFDNLTKMWDIHTYSRYEQELEKIIILINNFKNCFSGNTEYSKEVFVNLENLNQKLQDETLAKVIKFLKLIFDEKRSKEIKFGTTFGPEILKIAGYNKFIAFLVSNIFSSFIKPLTGVNERLKNFFGSDPNENSGILCKYPGFIRKMLILFHQASDSNFNLNDALKVLNDKIDIKQIIKMFKKIRIDNLVFIDDEQQTVKNFENTFYQFENEIKRIDILTAFINEFEARTDVEGSQSLVNGGLKGSLISNFIREFDSITKEWDSTTIFERSLKSEKTGILPLVDIKKFFNFLNDALSRNKDSFDSLVNSIDYFFKNNNIDVVDLFDDNLLERYNKYQSISNETLQKILNQLESIDTASYSSTASASFKKLSFKMTELSKYRIESILLDFDNIVIGSSESSNYLPSRTSIKSLLAELKKEDSKKFEKIDNLFAYYCNTLEPLKNLNNNRIKDLLNKIPSLLGLIKELKEAILSKSFGDPVDISSLLTKYEPMRTNIDKTLELFCQDNLVVVKNEFVKTNLFSYITSIANSLPHILTNQLASRGIEAYGYGKYINTNYLISNICLDPIKSMLAEDRVKKVELLKKMCKKWEAVSSSGFINPEWNLVLKIIYKVWISIRKFIRKVFKTDPISDNRYRIRFDNFEKEQEDLNNDFNKRLKSYIENNIENKFKLFKEGNFIKALISRKIIDDNELKNYYKRYKAYKDISKNVKIEASRLFGVSYLPCTSYTLTTNSNKGIDIDWQEILDILISNNIIDFKTGTWCNRVSKKFISIAFNIQFPKARLTPKAKAVIDAIEEVHKTYGKFSANIYNTRRVVSGETINKLFEGEFVKCLFNQLNQLTYIKSSNNSEKNLFENLLNDSIMYTQEKNRLEIMHVSHSKSSELRPKNNISLKDCCILAEELLAVLIENKFINENGNWDFSKGDLALNLPSVKFNLATKTIIDLMIGFRNNRDNKTAAFVKFFDEIEYEEDNKSELFAFKRKKSSHLTLFPMNNIAPSQSEPIKIDYVNAINLPLTLYEKIYALIPFEAPICTSLATAVGTSLGIGIGSCAVGMFGSVVIGAAATAMISGTLINTVVGSSTGEGKVKTAIKGTPVEKIANTAVETLGPRSTIIAGVGASGIIGSVLAGTVIGGTVVAVGAVVASAAFAGGTAYLASESYAHRFKVKSVLELNIPGLNRATFTALFDKFLKEKATNSSVKLERTSIFLVRPSKFKLSLVMEDIQDGSVLLEDILKELIYNRFITREGYWNGSYSTLEVDIPNRYFSNDAKILIDHMFQYGRSTCLSCDFVVKSANAQKSEFGLGIIE